MNKKFIFILLFLILILIGSIGFVGFMLFNNINQNQNNKIEKIETKEEYIYKANIMELILNGINDKGQNKLIKLSLSIKSNDLEIQTKVDNNIGEIKDAIIDIIMSNNTNNLLTKNGKDLLKSELLDKLKKILENDKTKINQVLFLEFVIK